MKLLIANFWRFFQQSPLAEGRELKLMHIVINTRRKSSPLAEGRELKCVIGGTAYCEICRPSRRGVN